MPELITADTDDMPLLLPLVRAYHDFEGIVVTDSERETALSPLLEENSDLGKVWLIRHQKESVGYIALCFGYSIEFGGRDAFIDEFYITEPARGKGLGHWVLKEIQMKAREYGVCAIHLEVARSNKRAQKSYAKAGFMLRQDFHLMSSKLGPVNTN